MTYSSLLKAAKLFSLVALSILLVQTQLYAQKRSRNRQTVSIGPKVGVNISNIAGDGVKNNSMQPGLAAGLMVNYSVVSHFGISAEALYSQKGAKFTNVPVSTTNNESYNLRINYIEVPIMGRYYLNTSGNFRPNLFIGPSFGFKLNAREANRELNGKADSPEEIDKSDTFQPMDVGVTAGLGLNFSIKNRQRFLFDARYTHGLSDITEAATKVNNSAITLTVGVSFGIGKKYEK